MKTLIDLHPYSVYHKNERIIIMNYNYRNLIPSQLESNLRLVQSSGACPEQYEMLYNDDEIALLHLRYGHFRVFNSRDQILYEAYPAGDDVFENNEREFYLTMGQLAVLEHLGYIALPEPIPTKMTDIPKTPKPDAIPVSFSEFFMD